MTRSTEATDSLCELGSPPKNDLEHIAVTTRTRVTQTIKIINAVTAFVMLERIEGDVIM